ncbi:hypothetical protein ABZU76_07980 [Amycolatopsis sp. NPDC005232]|uniref:hypothetical protein n=1 Tax=Amycolatopsis sp. NPDC005232 TaxID=3157027 RepID=UPI0033B5145F
MGNEEDAAKRVTDSVLQRAQEAAQQAQRQKQADQEAKGDYNSANGAVEDQFTS